MEWVRHLLLGPALYWPELTEVAKAHSEGVDQVWSNCIQGKKENT